MPSFQEQRSAQHVQPFFDTSKLQEVLRRKKPTKFFWCVPGSTWITMANGTQKRIAEIGTGEQVLGYKDGQLKPSTCLWGGATTVDTYLRVKVGTRELCISRNHEVLTPQGYVPAGQLKPDDTIGVCHAIENRQAFCLQQKMGIQGEGVYREAPSMYTTGIGLSRWPDRWGGDTGFTEDAERVLPAYRQHCEYRRGTDQVSSSVLLASGSQMQKRTRRALFTSRAQRVWYRTISQNHRTASCRKKGAVPTPAHIHCVSSSPTMESKPNSNNARDCERYEHAEFTWAAITSIEGSGTPEVLFDLTTSTHNYIANGVVVHNCDMSDMFGAWVPDGWIDQCFATMALTPQHIHMVLTKRPERMQAYASALQTPFRVANIVHEKQWNISAPIAWPLKQCWLGVSVETQATLNRLNSLCETPAAIRFASFEPLLEDLGHITPWLQPVLNAAGLDWAILGGESGPGARPCHVEWIASLREQCAATKTACFIKQMGSYSTRAPILGQDGPHRIRLHWRDKKGSDPDEWPASFRVQQFPAEKE